MSKERRTVTVEQEVDNYLSQNGRNASELVNELVKQHMNCGAGENQILEFRLQQARSEYKSAKSDAELKKQEVEELERRKRELNQEQQEQKKQTLREVINRFDVQQLRSLDDPVVDATDDELRPYADDLGMSIDELKDRIITESIDD